MDTFVESASSMLIVDDTKQEIVLRDASTTLTPVAPKKVFSIVPTTQLLSAEEFFALSPNPLIAADKNKALETIQSLLSTVQVLKEKIQDSMLSGPVCPYQQTLLEYLGPDYKCPTIYDIPYPKTYSTQAAISAIEIIGNKYDNILLSHTQTMSAEAADTNFVGITSQNIGHAFAVLSATANGSEYVIDRIKTSNHLEFAEIIRNLSTDYIIQNPLIVAHKLISRYVEINKD
jgi:hypothetical protein